jgi:hypothetical protein
VTRSRAGGNRSDYRVVLDFADGPSFGIEVNADGRDMARHIAEQTARACGWSGSVIKVVVEPVSRPRGEA